MKLKHFFRGTLRKEQVASAFLATLLDERHAFRQLFFTQAFPDEAAELVARSWTVEVEANQVDVRLVTGDTVVLVENKVKAGAVQSEQLLRYYTAQKQREPGRRVLAVYLAPRAVGMSEVNEAAACLHPGDRAAHVSWEKVLTFGIADDPDADLIASGIAEVHAALDDRLKYERVGGRERVAQVADLALEALRPLGIPLRRWTGRDFEEILSHGRPYTVWLDAAFEAETTPPWNPIDVVVSEDQLCLTLRCQFRLSTKGSKSPETRARWAGHFSSTNVDIVGAAYVRTAGNSWFKHELPNQQGTVLKLAAKLAALGNNLLEVLPARMGQAEPTD